MIGVYWMRREDEMVEKLLGFVEEVVLASDLKWTVCIEISAYTHGVVLHILTLARLHATHTRIWQSPEGQLRTCVHGGAEQVRGQLGGVLRVVPRCWPHDQVAHQEGYLGHPRQAARQGVCYVCVCVVLCIRVGVLRGEMSTCSLLCMQRLHVCLMCVHVSCVQHVCMFCGYEEG